MIITEWIHHETIEHIDTRQTRSTNPSGYSELRLKFARCMHTLAMNGINVVDSEQKY